MECFIRHYTVIPNRFTPSEFIEIVLSVAGTITASHRGNEYSRMALWPTKQSDQPDQREVTSAVIATFIADTVALYAVLLIYYWDSLKFYGHFVNRFSTVVNF